MESLRNDQLERGKGEQRLSVEMYVRRHPELASDPDTLAELILGEVLLRETAGESSGIDEYIRRYPQCAQQLQQRYRADLVTAIAPSDQRTIDMSPSPVMETIALDEAGQIAAQQAAFEKSSPKIPGYEIVSELGRGGMGVVYRAKQLSADRDVALKIVRNDVLDTLPLATRKHTLQRFTHEAHAAARLEHANLVPVYDVGQSGSMRYYAMRFVDGTSLYDMLREHPLDNRSAAQYIEPVVRGLHFAHEQGVLHRDVKPHNIIVERASNRPMLTDFGLAKFLERRDELTHAGDVMGTPSYMSPEQARDSGKVTAAADVYSLGATLYHILTSRPPFQSANIAETIRQVLHDEPVPPRQLNPGIDRDLETICLKCLQKEPAKRYESAGALADDLQRYLDHKPILARPISRTERVWRWCRRNPKLATAIGSAVFFAVFTVVVSVAGYYLQRRERIKSDTRLDAAEVILDDLATHIAEEELLNRPGMQQLRRDLLAKALKHYEYILRESGNDPAKQDKVAAAHFGVGLIWLETGEYDIAQRELELAREQRSRLLAEHPRDPRRIESLSDTFSLLGKLFVQRDLLADAAAAYARAGELREQLVSLDAGEREWQRKLASVRANLGMVELSQGQDQAGRERIRQAQERRLAILKEKEDFAAARRDLAMGYYMLAKFDSLTFRNLPEPRPIEKSTPIIVNLREAIKHFELLDTDDLVNRYRLATAYRQLGGLLSQSGQLEEAAEAYNSARPLIMALAYGNPDVREYQNEYVGLAMNQGALYDAQNDIQQALDAWFRAKEFLADLIARDPNDFDYRYDLANALDAIAEDYKLSDDLPEHVSTLEAVERELAILIANAPDDTKLITWQAEVAADRWLAQVILDVQEAEDGRSEENLPPTPSSLSLEPADKNE